jgi:hypothetical protein
MPVTVKAVQSPQDHEAFLKLGNELHRDEECWIPPFPLAYAHFLDRSANPYFEHADAEFFLAERDGRPVGQIAAHIDHALNEFKDNRWGLFGFFESENDQDVADALVGAASGWLAERGRDRMIGPLQFSTKEDPGLLVEGNETPPVVMQPWHPAFYADLLEGAGLRKAKDVLWREIELDEIPAELLGQTERWFGIAQDRYGVTIRRGSGGEDLERVFRFMMPIFAEDWGYVPWTNRELAVGLEMAQRQVGPGTLMAELNGELIGASMLVPDYNQTISNEDGHPAQSGARIDQARFLFMAVTARYRHLGVMLALSHAHIQEAREQQIGRIVIGWSWEDNENMNIGMARLGLPVAKRHRVYEKELAAEPAISE